MIQKTRRNFSRRFIKAAFIIPRLSRPALGYQPEFPISNSDSSIIHVVFTML